MTTKITCWECGNPSGQHKLSCDSRSRIDALQHFLDNLHNVPNDVLNYVSHKIYVESLERKLNFDKEEFSNNLQLPRKVKEPLLAQYNFNSVDDEDER